MTLHLTFASNRYVLQLSDRLVSVANRGSLTNFDETANKTVIYVARDAYVSIGYTGLAYIDGRPTDQWIAEKLIGEEVGSRRGPSGGIAARLSAGGNIPWYDIGTARRVLRSELFALSLRVGNTHRPHVPTLVMAGWQRRKRFSRPIAHVLAHGVLDNAAHSLPRDFWWRNSFMLSALPPLPVLHSRLIDLRAELKKGPMPDDAEILMADVLRFAADNSPGISKDYLAVLLPRPSLRSIRMRYVPNENEIKAVAQSGDFPFESLGPFGYSPWIVTQRYQAGPQVLVNPSSVRIGPPDLLLEFEGPSSEGGLVHEAGFISQVRPEWRPKRF